MKKQALSVLSIFFISVLFFQCTSPQKKNNTDELHTRLHQYGDSILLAQHLPGLIIGVWNDETKVSYLEGFGFSNVEKQTKMLPTLPFRIGSITKTFVVTNVLQLVEEGLIDLDQMVAAYIDSIPHATRITVRMLCNMTSGYENYSASASFDSIMANDPLRKWDKWELIRLGTSAPLRFIPGEEVYYSNTNTLILAAIIEKVTGMAWEESVLKRTIKPLNLTKTYFAIDNEFTSNGVQGYELDTSDFSFTNITTKYNVSWGSAAGNMISTAEDLRNWATALVDGTLISDSLHQQRFFSDVNLAPEITYGLGMFNLRSYWGHNGGIPGYNVTLMRDPDNKITILVVYNYLYDKYPSNQSVMEIQALIEKYL